jgi:hypothetical protein
LKGGGTASEQLRAPVEAGNPILEFWYFHFPNYVLAALMYSVLGRFILSFFFAAGSTNYIFRAFVWLTDPFIRMAAFITPRAVPFLVLLIFTFFWLGVARFALLLTLLNFGLAPTAR